jgi:hypothetical protein
MLPKMTVKRRAFKDSGAAEGQALCAVVVTICNGASYDDIFHRMPQRGVKGLRVVTYAVSGSLKPLRRVLKCAPDMQERTAVALGLDVDFVKLLRDIRLLEASSVVFNWECCAACSDESFGPPAESRGVLRLMKLLLDHGHMVMCSDFSLKALIRQWNTDLLGPCPFFKVAECVGNMSLHFDAARVARCPSAQLQRLGDICGKGFAQIQAMEGNIVYTVDHGVAQRTKAYDLEVLTVATGLNDGFRSICLPSGQLCEVGSQRGFAGHVLLRYPSGGLLLTAAGHWSELVQVDVAEERLLGVLESQYGAGASRSFLQRLANAHTPRQRANLCQSVAVEVVQVSSPGGYSASKRLRSWSEATVSSADSQQL